ncbi:MAG TPA: hypothetical protein VFS29_07565 [Motilibacteraceae bacterium]|nr:hypothetical protein [Motilibacteraceae bacterium]
MVEDPDAVLHDAVLQVAVHSRPDDARVVAVILGGQVTWRWQLAGDALLAVDAGTEGRRQAAGVVVDALHQRGDRGDWFLAANLVAAVGLPGPTILADSADRLPDLIPLPVDLDSVADVIDSRGAGGWVDPSTGLAADRDLVDPYDLDREEDEGDEQLPGWIELDALGSREAYQDMADFTGTVSEGGLRARLDRALRGERPFRRFADTLHQTDPDEVSRWYAFRDERRLGRARRYLVDCGYLPLPVSTRNR